MPISRPPREGAGAAGRARLVRVGAIAALAVALAGGLAVSVASVERVRSGGEGADAARLRSLDSQRYDYWRVALDSFASNPIAGVGAGGFSVEWLRERPAGSAGAADAHSLYAETAVELGLVGLAALGLFIGAIAACVPRALRHDPVLVAGPVAALAAFAFHAGIDWDWELPALTLVAVLLAAVVVAAADRGGRADACNASAAMEGTRVAIDAPGGVERPRGLRRVRTLWRLWRREREDPVPFYRLLAAEAADDLERRYGPLAGRRIADLGCGPGFYTDALRALGAEVIPVDNDLEEMTYAGEPPDGALVADATAPAAPGGRARRRAVLEPARAHARLERGHRRDRARPAAGRLGLHLVDQLVLPVGRARHEPVPLPGPAPGPAPVRAAPRAAAQEPVRRRALGGARGLDAAPRPRAAGTAHRARRAALLAPARVDRPRARACASWRCGTA